MDDITLEITEEPVPDDIPADWEDTAGTIDELPDVGDDDSSGDEDPVWEDGETGDGSTGNDDGFTDEDGTGEEELIGDASPDEEWLIDGETWLGDGEDRFAGDEFAWEEDSGSGTGSDDIAWEILIIDDFIRIYDFAGGPKTEGEIPADDTGTETATLDGPAICVIFDCGTII